MKLPIEIKRVWMIGIIFVLIVFIFGTVGYHYTIGSNFFQSFYQMLMITSGIGFTDSINLSFFGRIITIIITLLGFLAFAFWAASFASLMIFFIQNDILTRWFMNTEIKSLNKHVIICGYSKVSEILVDKIRDTHGNKIVIIDNDNNKIEKIEENGFLYIKGDAKSKKTLMLAGIDKALYLVCDVAGADNLFVSVLAKKINKDIKIIVKLSNKESEEIKESFKDIGVDFVVDPYHAGADAIFDILNSDIKEVE